jgi:carbonic anhydrase
MLLALALAALAASPTATPTSGTYTNGPAPDDAIQRLKAGNARYIAGTYLRADESAGRRADLVAGERPWCTVLSCSDSRVPTERIFDVGLGEIAAVRVAGNVAEPVTAASIERAAQLGSRLVVVMGHEACDSVKSAMAAGSLGPNLDLVSAYIRPALTSGMALESAVESNVRHQIETLSESATLHALVASGKARIVGALYDLDTGRVRFLDEPGAPAAKPRSSPPAPAAAEPPAADAAKPAAATPAAPAKDASSKQTTTTTTTTAPNGASTTTTGPKP